jgi:hypothetical protein
MLLLSSTSEILQLLTSGSEAVAVQISYADYTAPSTVDPETTTNVVISAAGTVTIVPSPSGSAKRNVKELSIYNTDGSGTLQVTVIHYDGSVQVQKQTATLQPNYALHYEDKEGWYVTDGAGGRQGLQGIPGANGTNGTNGTNAGNIGSATLDFGTGNGTANVVVTGQATILTTSAVQAFFMADTTTDHNDGDHMFAALVVSLTCGAVVAGTGFTIYATCSDDVVGTFKVRFVWN